MSSIQLRFILRAGVSGALLTLAACGGGGGGGSSPATASANGSSSGASTNSGGGSTTVVTDSSETAQPAAPSPGPAVQDNPAAPSPVENIIDATTDTVGNVVDAVTSGAGSVVGGAATVVDSVVDAVSDAVTGTAGSDPADAVEEIIDAIDDAATGAPTGEISPTGGVSTPSTSSPSSSLSSSLDLFVTRSGRWRLEALAAQGDASVYRMTLDEAPGFVREFACRRLFTKEQADTRTLDLLSVTLLGQQATVAQGACRVVQNMEPVAPRVEWIREAVASGVVPAYRRERALRPARFKPLAPDASRSPYDPASLGGTSSSSNYVGVTSKQGGEYGASRGFLHDIDARLIDAALHDEDAAIAAIWPEFTAYSFYSLSHPQGAAWSAVNHVTVDPQFPAPGDRPWETDYGTTPNTAVDSMVQTSGWERDVSHLENTGFVHWLATEDPIAGLLVQRQAAYALASEGENYRGGYGIKAPSPTYRGFSNQERGLFNVLSALWKSREVAKRVTSSKGTLIWSLTRAERQADEVIAHYDGIASRIYGATPASAADYAAKVSGILFGGQGTEAYNMADGTQVSFTQTSTFMLQQYGKEPLWLWTKAGDQRVAKWFATYARSLVVRMTVVGGARGIDGSAGVRGSGFPIAPSLITAEGYVRPAAPDFSTDTGWGQWAANLPLKKQASRTSFDGAALHTTLQTEGLLLLAKNANLNVQDIDTAINNIQNWKNATTTYAYEPLQMMKHMSAPN